MPKVAKITLGTLASICLFLAYGGIGAIETGSMGLGYMLVVFIYIGLAGILAKVAGQIGRSERKQSGRKNRYQAMPKMPVVARTELNRKAL